MKHLIIVIITALIFYAGCDLKQFSSGNSKPVNASPANMNDTFIPPKVGDFTRINAPKSMYITDAPDTNKENLSASYTVPNDVDKLTFAYAKLYDNKQLNDWIKGMLSNSTGECEYIDAEDLSARQQQGSFYKIVKREPSAGGEIIIMHKDSKSLCNKGQKEEYEKVYFIRGDTVFAAIRYDFKKYGAAEQFMNEFLKTR